MQTIIPSFIRTYSGHNFNPLQPQGSQVDIRDIAHALSNLCRYTGHVKHFYSVGYHSCLVSKMMRDDGLSDELQLYGLLHDASEAYMNDIASPVKKSLHEYKAYEENLIGYVLKSFGLDPVLPKEVHDYDKKCFNYEAKYFFNSPTDWNMTFPDDDFVFLEPSNSDVKALFKKIYLHLKPNPDEPRLKYPDFIGHEVFHAPGFNPTYNYTKPW